MPLSSGPLQSGGDITSLVDPIPLQVWQLLLLVGVGLSVAVVYRMARPRGRWLRRARSRLLLGVPWGTLASMVFVVGVYLFLQGGLEHRYNPVTYAFQATGYAYPTGILTASFAHTSFSHLFGNMVGTLVFGTVAEVGFSHFPRRRGETAFSGLRTNPYLRALVFFLAIFPVGLALSAFSWGPVIGFSGVVFAFAGFALVTRPLLAVVGILLTQSSVPSLLYNAVNNPVSQASPSPSAGGVWFANIAIQGHVFGFLFGVLAGVAIVRLRRERPAPTRVWFAAVVFALAQGMWVVYWYLGNSRYILFRGLGVAIAFVLAALVVVTATGSGRSLLPTRWVSDDVPTALSRWGAAAVVLLLVVLFMSSVGAVVNLTAVGSADLPNEPVEIRDYTVGYSENTTNELLSIVDIPGIDQLSNVQASGVIVASEKRNIWQVHTSTNRLAFRGYARVLVGGPGWRDEVLVTRTGWSVVGGSSTYRVRLHTDEVRRTVFRSEPAVSEVVIANRSIAMQTVDERFEVGVVVGNESVETGRLPDPGGNVTVGDIRFERVRNRLYANYDGTRVQVASKKEPRIERFRD